MAYYNPKTYNIFTRVWQAFIVWVILVPVYYVFYRLKVFGKENIPKGDKGFVIMPNHLSNNDPPLICCALNLGIAYMAKKELFDVPFWGSLIKSLGAFSIDREKVEKTSIKAAKEILNKGWNVGIFLEGTRSKNPGFLGKPNLGPAFISNLAKVPIIPVGIVGSNKLFGPITVRIGQPFYPDSDLEKAKWECAEKLSELTGFKIPARDS